MKRIPRARTAQSGARCPAADSLHGAAGERLPFKLTRAQPACSREIRRDLRAAHPMQRLLQGDVGSGKTIVAALAALAGDRVRLPGGGHGADRNPGGAALSQIHGMAGLPLADRLASGRLTGERAREGARRDSQRRSRRSRSARTRCSRKPLRATSSGLAIVDEQHRFGVAPAPGVAPKGIGDARTS